MRLGSTWPYALSSDHYTYRPPPPDILHTTPGMGHMHVTMHRVNNYVLYSNFGLQKLLRR